MEMREGHSLVLTHVRVSADSVSLALQTSRAARFLLKGRNGM